MARGGLAWRIFAVVTGSELAFASPDTGGAKAICVSLVASAEDIRGGPEASSKRHPELIPPETGP